MFEKVQLLKKKPDNRLIIRLLFLPAERKGFEPLVPHSTTVFKTAAIDHSAISPFEAANIQPLFQIQKNNYIVAKQNRPASDAERLRNRLINTINNQIFLLN